jgi:hypothetical protein
VPLRANGGISSQGYKLVGDGFVCSAEEGATLLAVEPRHAEIVKPLWNGKDLTTRPRGVFVIDFGLREEAEARTFPVLYDRVRDRVKPERDAVRDRIMRERWWMLGRPRGELRDALAGLPRYLATPEVSKHRFFTFLGREIAPDGSLVCIATADAFHLGVLSSAIHLAWALAAGARMGIDATPRYSKRACFEAFPFPEPAPSLRARIATLADQIDRHRREALARSAKLGMTAIYNVVDRLRSGEPLTKAEREVHALAACGTLRDMHDELDRLVAHAYGWSWPEPATALLERLVALHDARAAEEATGHVRWLRPDFQAKRFGAAQPSLDVATEATSPAVAPAATLAAWPTDAVGQITALRHLAATAPVTVDEATTRFAGASKAIVARHLETLAILGEVRPLAGGRYAAALVAA